MEKLENLILSIESNINELELLPGTEKQIELLEKYLLQLYDIKADLKRNQEERNKKIMDLLQK